MSAKTSANTRRFVPPTVPIPPRVRTPSYFPVREQCDHDNGDERSSDSWESGQGAAILACDWGVRQFISDMIYEKTKDMHNDFLKYGWVAVRDELAALFAIVDGMRAIEDIEVLKEKGRHERDNMPTLPS